MLQHCIIPDNSVLSTLWQMFVEEPHVVENVRCPHMFDYLVIISC